MCTAIIMTVGDDLILDDTWQQHVCKYNWHCFPLLGWIIDALLCIIHRKCGICGFFPLPKFTAGVVTGSASVSVVYSRHEERMLGIMRTSQSQLEQPELTLNPRGGAAFSAVVLYYFKEAACPTEFIQSIAVSRGCTCTRTNVTHTRK